MNTSNVPTTVETILEGSQLLRYAGEEVNT